MTDLRKAAEMALEALEWNYGTDLENIENCMAWLDKMNATIPALRQALAQPEQEPVAWGFRLKDGAILDIKNADEHEGYEKIYTVPLYTTPSNREWVGLTDEDLKPLCDEWRIMYGGYVDDFAKAIEAKLKEKNGG